MDVAALEAYWHDRPVDGVPPGCLPWLPYPADDFDVLLGEAVLLTLGTRFLDVGCGIGTKCVLAASRGLLAAGVEVVPAYQHEAARLGIPLFAADARMWDGYGEWDIVYVNCPLAADEAEAVLELRVQDRMRPGGVLISVNSAAPPGAGWDVALRLNAHDLVAVKL